MRKLSISKPKRRASFDHDENLDNIDVRSPPARASFDHNEYSRRSTIASTKSPRSRHGFFSEFELIPPAPTLEKLQSTYSLRTCMCFSYKYIRIMFRYWVNVL